MHLNKAHNEDGEELAGQGDAGQDSGTMDVNVALTFPSVHSQVPRSARASARQAVRACSPRTHFSTRR